MASLCGLTSLGCSRREQPLEDGAPATKHFAAPAHGSSQQQVLDATLDESIQYVIPEGWSPAQVSDPRRLTFQITEGPFTAEMTAMGLPGSATQLLPNVNLWRRKVGLASTTQKDLDEALEAIEVNGRRGHYMTLVGPPDAERPRAMLAVLASDQDRTWFFNLLGDAELVVREKTHFEEFVRSVTFAPASEDKTD